jgi:hypothetical protein
MRPNKPALEHPSRPPDLARNLPDLIPAHFEGLHDCLCLSHCGERIKVAFAGFRVPPERAENYGSNRGFFSVDRQGLPSAAAYHRGYRPSGGVRGMRKAPVQGAWDRGQYLRVVFRLGGIFPTRLHVSNPFRTESFPEFRYL